MVVSPLLSVMLLFRLQWTHLSDALTADCLEPNSDVSAMYCQIMRAY